MIEKHIELKEGIKLHLLKRDIFKTNLVCIMLTTPLKRGNVTKEALIPFLLKRGSKNFPNQMELNKKLEGMYGASYDCIIDKIGDNHVFKYYLESINDRFTLENENLLEKSINLLLEIILNPYLENGKFKEEFFEQEKENLRKIIDSKIDNKDFYALNRCIESMYKKEGYGLFKYGYTSDLENLTLEEFTKSYFEFINNCKIDIYVSGEFNEEELKKVIIQNKNYKKLNSRKENFIINNSSTECKQKVDKAVNIKDVMDISQGKLVIGLDVLLKEEEIQYPEMVYNAILGDGSNSMIFQNVREKEGLVYTGKSQYNRMKSNIFIRCGIETENYEKTNSLLKVQMENIAKGNFTDEDIENAKIYIVSAINSIETEQYSEIVYLMGQELTKVKNTFDEYIEKISRVTKEDIIRVANNIQINTIYFLGNK